MQVPVKPLVCCVCGRGAKDWRVQVWSIQKDAEVGAQFPGTELLRNTPSVQALSRKFLAQGACMLQRSGLGALAASVRGTAPADVLTWPQVLSYESQPLMPTGREGSLPGALLRGVYAAQSSADVRLIIYDPRSPLDAMEVQDVLPDMYTCAAPDFSSYSAATYFLFRKCC